MEEHLERLAKGELKTTATRSAPDSEKPPAAAEASSSSMSRGSGSSDDEEARKQRRHKGSKKRKREKGEMKAKSSKKHKKDKKGSRRASPRASEGRKPAEGAPKPVWEGAHPWRPFDRDKDLDLKPKAANPDQLIRQAAAMTAGRFQSAGNTRHFL